MAKIGKETGPSDLLQPGEPLHLAQAEVVPGSKPESANEATTKAVVEERKDDDEVIGEAGPEESVAPEDGDVVAVDEDEDEDEDELDEGEDENAPESDTEPEPDPNEGAVATFTTPAYDPSLYTVDEVNTYLGDRYDDGDQDEIGRVLEAERGGKARSGILTKWDV